MKKNKAFLAVMAGFVSGMAIGWLFADSEEMQEQKISGEPKSLDHSISGRMKRRISEVRHALTPEHLNS